MDLGVDWVCVRGSSWCALQMDNENQTTKSHEPGITKRHEGSVDESSMLLPSQRERETKTITPSLTVGLLPRAGADRFGGLARLISGLSTRVQLCSRFNQRQIVFRAYVSQSAQGVYHRRAIGSQPGDRLICSDLITFLK